MTRIVALALLVACITPASTLAQGVTPFTLTGWNRDVITSTAGADSASSFDNSGAAWYSQGALQTGGGATPAGLPVTTFTSAFDSSSRFQLRSATVNNILAVTNQTGVTGVSSSAALSVTGSVRANSISILTASGSGGGNLGLTITYVGGITQVVSAVSAPDWLQSFVTRKSLATDVGRNTSVSLLNSNINSNGSNLTVSESVRFNLQQTNIALTRPDLDIASFTFTADTAANVAGMSGVFAISYTPVPEPGGLLTMAAAGAWGLRRLRRREA